MNYLSERDICSKYITPAILRSGWDLHTQIREEVSFTAGRIYVKGKLYARGKQKRADYILYYRPNLPIALIEAKDARHSVRAGMQQALAYAEALDIPFVFSSNGTGFFEHDKSMQGGQLEREISFDDFPSPEELWRRYKQYKGISSPEAERIITQDYYQDPSGRAARYYQVNAVNRTVEAIAKGENRILLVMATGTGKTYTAFQIIWRLWKTGKKQRILFLADRNALIQQTKRGDFKHFRDKMTIVRHHEIDKSYEIYLALYQGLTGTDADGDVYKEFSRDFFDLVVIDECHRGSAAADSNWRRILEYFDAATHIGLTATPKESKDVSNTHYFGEPIYTYSLKQGIDDGYLAPYKVIRIGIDKDLEGWRPEKGKKDVQGDLVEDRLYNTRDFDRNLVIEERTKLVAQKVSEFLKNTNRYAKTIVFCVDINHAERMRNALVNENPDLYAENAKYVMQITGDNDEGKMELDNFIDPEQTHPVIATTSKLMTTGVDAQTCKLIVLDSNIQSMTEFKQIIGRGTRINEEFGKYYFSIMDFRNVTNLFADPDFDGDPVQVYEPGPDDPVIEPETSETDAGFEEKDLEFEKPDVTFDPGWKPDRKSKVYVNQIEVSVLNERVQYYGPDGKLISESLQEYARKNLKQQYRKLDDFLNRWNAAEKKQALIEELQEAGVLLHELQGATGQDMDPFDLICHVAFDMPPLTRRERAEQVKKRNYFTKYGDQARQVLESLLDKYAETGIESLEDRKVLTLDPINRFGAPMEIIGYFGGPAKYQAAIRELEAELYRRA